MPWSLGPKTSIPKNNVTITLDFLVGCVFASLQDRSQFVVGVEFCVEGC